jgi:homoserine acetyltransferase
MNQLLKKTIDITWNHESLESIISKVDANIYIVGINSDLFLLRRRIEIPTTKLENSKNNVFCVRLTQHGHDAF